MDTGNLEEQILAIEQELSAIAFRREVLQKKLLELRYAKNQSSYNNQLLIADSQSLNVFTTFYLSTAIIPCDRTRDFISRFQRGTLQIQLVK